MKPSTQKTIIVSAISHLQDSETLLAQLEAVDSTRTIKQALENCYRAKSHAEAYRDNLLETETNSVTV